MKALIVPLLAGVLLATAVSPIRGQVPDQNSEIIIVPAGDNFLRWTAQVGRTYFIQASPDLQQWQWSDLIETGHGQVISHEIGSTSGRAFFRLAFTDNPIPAGVTPEEWDADGDGLSNSQELATYGTHPLRADTSGDGLPDGWSVFFGLDPLANNAAGLFQGSSITNLAAYSSGVLPLPGASLGDHDGDTIPNENDLRASDRDEFAVEISTERLEVLWQNGNEIRNIIQDSKTYSFDAIFVREPTLGVISPVSYAFIVEGQAGELIKCTAVVKALSGAAIARKLRYIEVLDRNHGSIVSASPEVEVVDTHEFVVPPGELESQVVDINPGLTDVLASTPSQSTSVFLIPIDIEVLKEGSDSAPVDGLVILKADAARYRLTPHVPDALNLLKDDVQWYWRILKWNGTYGEWRPYINGEGTTFSAQPRDSGIYEVKASIGGEDSFFMRRMDDKHSAKRRYENECFGVADEAWQIGVREEAKLNLGSKLYAQAVQNANIGPNLPKCNLFVGDKATAGGAPVPRVKGSLNQFFPVANQWAGSDSDGENHIPNWTLLGEVYPQPGFVVARVNTAGPGHCGIVDYDGSWIGAGSDDVNRKADLRDDISLRSGKSIYQPARFRKYTP
jgi:hypothetical protein